LTSKSNRLIQWERYPKTSQSPNARNWLTFKADLGLADSSIEAYGRGLEDYFAFAETHDFEAEHASKLELASYVRSLLARRSPRPIKDKRLFGLANATIQQRLTAIRLYYDFLIEEGVRTNNPVGRGRYTANRGFGGSSQRGLLPRYRKLPWIPAEEQWLRILDHTRKESARNRVMLAMAYDAGLRREELCSLEIPDIDPSARLIRIRAETTKNRGERIVPYSLATSMLLVSYLQHRRSLSRNRGPLFLSESPRNRAHPISIWTWSKIVEGISSRSEVPQLTTHTFRHLCLTDLARAGWDIHEIATFAGHRSLQTTLLYIHLSGRELSKKLEQGMAQLHAWRARMLAGLPA